LFFFLEKKEPKIQGERPTPIFFSLEKSSQCHRKNWSTHLLAQSLLRFVLLSFAKASRTITNV
jgi:hypothetical protein